MPQNELPPGAVIPAEAEDATSLLEYWRILVERRAVLLTCLTACVAIGLLYTFLSTPLYQATTTLQIERHGPEILTFEDVVGVDPAGYQDFYQTQFRIIRSRTVLSLAVERLDLVNDPRYVSRRGSPLSRLYRWAHSLFPGEDLEEDDPRNRVIEFIAERLSVIPLRNSHLVSVSFVDRDADLASDVANAVADAYQQFSLEARYTATTQASEFLDKEVVRLQAEIETLERRFQNHSNEAAILSFSDGSQDISEQALADLNRRLAAARGTMAIAKARHSEVQSEPPASLPDVLSSPLINNLKQQYAEVERHYMQMSERFRPGWPALTQLEKELRQARERLDIETDLIAEQVRQVARSQYEQAVGEVANLEQQVEQQKTEVQRVNRAGIEWAGLRAEIDTRRNVLSDLVARRSETEASGQLRDNHASNIRVVDPAEAPERPARPRKKQNLILSLILGLGLGVAIAFLLHYVDNTVKTEHDIERYGAGVAVLGHVPLFEPLRIVPGGRRQQNEQKEDRDSGQPTAANPDLASHQSPRSSFAEAFKNLRTSLLLAAPDHPPRRIHITSCGPGDGKSTIALNLAIVLTQMGRKVLLIDADLRRPRIHRALELANDVGLSSYLTGNAAPERLFQQCGIPLLTAITSGPTPPNPSELLDSPSLDSLLSGLDENGQYDHVLLDSPPALQVADSLILATRSDVSILVVRAAATSRESLAESVGRLRQGRANVAGALLNAVSERSRYYYHRRYGYYKGHYYTQDPEQDRSSSGSLGGLPFLSKVKNRKRRRAG